MGMMLHRHYLESIEEEATPLPLEDNAEPVVAEPAVTAEPVEAEPVQAEVKQRKARHRKSV